jgi:hypothetical protein
MAGFALRPKDLASRTQRRVRIQKAQLLAAKVSNPRFQARKFPDISKRISQSGMCKFESSQVSQAVRLSQVGPQLIAEKPANGGLSEFGSQSPES